MAQSIGGSGGKGPDANGLVGIGGTGSRGGDGAEVTVSNQGSIKTKGDGARGIVAQSIGGGGGDGGMAIALTSSDGPRHTASSDIAVGGNGGDGADSGDVTVNHSGTIQVDGENSYGIFAQSVSGGGGTAGLSIAAPEMMAADYVISTLIGGREGAKGDAGSVFVNSTGHIIVNGAGSQAIFSQSGLAKPWAKLGCINCVSTTPFRAGQGGQRKNGEQGE